MSIRSKLIAASVATSSMLVAVAAHAGTISNTVPEPGTFALVGLAAVVGIVVSRNRRK
jgi:uncharacterized membrane protein